jgi:hypothetical protein
MSGLTNVYVEKLGKKLFRNKFLGVYPADILPKNSNKNKCCSIIFNTGNSNTVGEHFVAFYWTKSEIHYFDSFGEKLKNKNIKKFLKHFPNHSKIYNCKKIQADNSTFCGFFCLAYLMSKFNKIPSHVFYQQFSKIKLKKNDQKVVNTIVSFI